jgi:hypothetical protein
MSVPPDVRAAERQIDESVERLPVWQAGRSALLRSLLDYARDTFELAFLKISHAQMTGNRAGLHAALALEQHVQAGVFNALKWAFAFARAEGTPHFTTDDELHELVQIGTTYEVLVDALKLARHNKHTIRVDPRERILTIFEGRALKV